MKNKVTLYIATHNKTGLKYFGKTTKYFTQQDLQKYYHGSGTYWKKHLEKHGDNVTMEIYGIYSLNEVKEVALKFSRENNIVENYDVWANHKEEDGFRGGRMSRKSVNKRTKSMTETKNSKEWKETKGIIVQRKTVKTKNSKEWKEKVSGRNHFRVKPVYIFNEKKELIYKVQGSISKFLKDKEMPLEAFKLSYQKGGRPLFINKVSLTLADKKYHKYAGWSALKNTMEFTYKPKKNMSGRNPKKLGL